MSAPGPLGPVVLFNNNTLTTTGTLSLATNSITSRLTLTDGAVANWIGTRYYAVDYDNGNDTNLGYSDVSMAAAGVNTVAIKTLTRLRQIFPKIGNSQVAVVAIRARASGNNYLTPGGLDDDLDFLQDVYGYEQILVRGTDTQATASSTAFANDAADRIFCGARVVPGTSAYGTGYNPVAPITTNSFNVQIGGGGAPALAAEPALIGKRIRFASNTTTVALQNICGMIYVNGVAQITLATTLPATPVASDVFYIEEPGVSFRHLLVRTSNPNNKADNSSFVQIGIQIAGLRMGAVASAPALTIRGLCAQIQCAFIDVPNITGADFSAISASSVDMLTFSASYNSEALTSVGVGTGFRAGGFTIFDFQNLTITSSAAFNARFQIQNGNSFAVGAGCYSLLGALISNCAAGLSTTTLGSGRVGITTGSTFGRFRITGSTVGAGLGITASNCAVQGVSFAILAVAPSTGDPCIVINGMQSAISIDDCIGSTVNTITAIDLASARQCTLTMGTIAANTVVCGVAAQTIRGVGNVFYVHADYARTNLYDDAGNTITGSANAIITNQPLLCVNGGVSPTLPQYHIVSQVTGGGSRQMRLSQADTAANASNILGVTQSATGAAVSIPNAMVVNTGMSWVQFTVAPTTGDTAYLSSTVAGQASSTAGSQVVPIGFVVAVSGTLGLVALRLFAGIFGSLPGYKIHWNSGGNYSNNNFMLYGAQDTTEARTQIVISRARSVSTLVVSLLAAPGVGNTHTFTIRKNGVNTALAVSITGASTTGANTTNVVSFAQFDLLSLQVVLVGGGATTGRFSVEVA